MQEQALEATSAMSTAAVGLVAWILDRMQTDANLVGRAMDRMQTTDPIQIQYIQLYRARDWPMCHNRNVDGVLPTLDRRRSRVDHPLERGVEVQDAIPPIFHSTRFPWHRNNEPPSALTACGSSLVVDGRRTSQLLCTPSLLHANTATSCRARRTTRRIRRRRARR